MHLRTLWGNKITHAKQEHYSYLNLMTVDVTAPPTPTGPNKTKLVPVTQTYLHMSAKNGSGGKKVDLSLDC